MWRRLSEEELKIKRAYEAKKYALTWAGIVLFITGVATKIGYSKYKKEIDPISSIEFLMALPLLLGLSIITYYVVNSYYRSRRIDNLRFCLKCQKTYQDQNQEKCSCGGTIEYLDDCTTK